MNDWTIFVPIALAGVACVIVGLMIGTEINHTINQSQLSKISTVCDVYSVVLDKNSLTANCKDGTSKNIK